MELLYFKKWNFLAASLKNSYISGENLQSLGNKNFLYFLRKGFPNFGVTADQFALFSQYKSMHLFIRIFYVIVKITFL